MSADASNEWTRACTAEALRSDGRREMLVGRTAVLLVWEDDRPPTACNAHCPHAFAPLIDGTVAEGRIHCARHQASFDLKTGAVDGGWCLPALAIHDARIEADWVWVRLRPGCGAGR